MAGNVRVVRELAGDVSAVRELAGDVIVVRELPGDVIVVWEIPGDVIVVRELSGDISVVSGQRVSRYFYLVRELADGAGKKLLNYLSLRSFCLFQNDKYC